MSVTICTPGTKQCQTIPNILLDTGSYGLRIFSSVISVPLTAETDSTGKSIAECTEFGSGADWGPVKMADVILGGEAAVTIPIHTIDATFASVPNSCGTVDSDPASTGFNGILGVGLFVQDCGDACAQSDQNNIYYACDGIRCTGTSVTLANQLANPVASLSQDNNGVILDLPSVPAGGNSVITGYLILGIDTETNNSSGMSKLYQADQNGNFTTQYKRQTFSSSFIDSGSNGLFFPDTTIATCTGNAAEFFCPASTLSLSATQMGADSTAQNVVPFNIANAATLLTPTGAFDNIGGAINGALASDFDWGLPFFFGRIVYVGIDAKKSNLGTGPYWGY